MYRYLSMLCLFFCCLSIASAQTPKGSIKGVVLDRVTQQPLYGVNIVIEGTQRGTITNPDGVFAISDLADGIYNLIFTYIGYSRERIQDISILQGAVSINDVELTEEAIPLGEVVIVPGSFSIIGNTPISRQTLGADDIKNISFAEDITRAVSRLPGVSSNDFSSKFAVRGGESDEVLMILDGMELYDPFHQRDFAGGLFSIVDIETIEGIDLLTGGFSAEYGNRQSGVFEMKTKQIRDGKRHTAVGLSVMNARLYTAGSFDKDRGSYLFSGRRGMLDQEFKLLGKDENIPVYYDAMGKIEYKLNAKHALSFYALHAGDHTEVRDIVPEAFDIHDTEYRNTYGWVTLKSFYNPRLFSRTLLYGGILTHKRQGSSNKYEDSDKLLFSLLDKRNFDFLGIKQDWDWDVSQRFYLKGGFDLKRLGADYDYSYSMDNLQVNTNREVEEVHDVVVIQKEPSGEQTSAYLSARFMAFPRLFFETGIRHDYASYTNDNLWSPRVSFAYSFSKNTFLRGAWGYYYQTQFMNNLNVNFHTSTFNPAELSKHYVLGLEHVFGNGISLRLDGYFKDISHISPTYQNLRDPWEVFPESRNDVVKLDISGATAKGLELFLKYDMGKKVSWWLSYALAKAEEDIRNLEFDGFLTSRTGKLPRLNNQDHTIYVDLNYRPNRKYHFNVSWQYYDGWPLTTYAYDFVTLANGDLHFYQIHDEFRGSEYPAYHRMDIRINRNFRLQNSKITAFLHLVNVYNRENLRKFDVDVRDGEDNLVPDGQGGYRYFHDDKNWFGFIPAFGLSVEF